MTPLADLLALLRTDLGDPDGELLAENDLVRAISRGLAVVCNDLGLTYGVVENGGALGVDPDLSAQDQELVLLRAHAFCAGMLRSAASANFAFSSADKKVDKTMQAQAWGDLEKDLLARYKAAVARIRPETADGVLTVDDMRPRVFEVGRHHHHGRDRCS